MKQNTSRLDILADGIFAIVMTILVFEIRVPNIFMPTESDMVSMLISLRPLFLSYILSFTALFTYWRGYHSIVSDFAKSSHVNFQNLAAIFLMRLYAWKSNNIKNKKVTKSEQIHAHIRIFVPIFFAILAIPISSFSPTLAQH